MKNVLIIISSSFLFLQVAAQNDTDSVVSQVGRNNKAIRANIKLNEARVASFKTGLTLYDPFVEYDYMFGSPAGAGNQRDFAVSQRLDFPTVYKRKKELSGSQITRTDLERQVFRREVLLEAKQLSLQVIYLNRKLAELSRRQAATAKLEADIRKKLDRGDAIILDMNKAKLQLLNIKNELALADNEKTILQTKLTELNGGIPVNIADTLYPALPVIPEFEKLDSIIEASDPLIKVYEQEKTVMAQQIRLQKAMNLPKLETGYHSQGILGQNYRGFHVGVSVPLWENRNRLNTAKAELDYATAAAESHRLEHRQTNRQNYEQLEVRGKAMLEHRELLSSMNNGYLLGKALSLGQITVVQYFYEESFYFTAYDRYLQMELEYHKAAAQLFRHLL